MSRPLIGVCALVFVVATARGQGGLAVLRDHVPSSASGYVVVADVDTDGDPDLITTDGGVFLNDGDGLFSAHPQSSPAVTSSSGKTGSAAAGDLDGDGDPDAIVVREGAIRFWRNIGGGRFVENAFSLPSQSWPGTGLLLLVQVRLVDVEGDDDLDILFAPGALASGFGATVGGSGLWINSGSGSFTATVGRVPSVSTAHRHVDVVDVDGDGDEDVLLLEALSGHAVLWVNDGSGTFAVGASPVPGTFRDQAVGDLDGDGVVDLVYTGPGLGGTLEESVVLGLGGGAFAAPVVTSLGTATGGQRLMLDVDGDGPCELVRFDDGRASTHVYAGSATFGAPLAADPIDLVGYADAATSSDLDGDGDLDLVVEGQRGTRVLLGTAQAALRSTTGSVSWELRTGALLADLDEDGHLDLVAGDGSDQLVIATNDGTGRFVDALPACAGSCGALDLMVLVDGDRDGRADLVAFTAQGASFRSNLGGTFGPAIPLTGMSDVASAAVGDVDGDGFDDLVLGRCPLVITSQGLVCQGGYANTVHLNVMGGLFGPAVPFYAPGSASQELALGDADGDGDLDVFETTGSLPTSLARLSLNDGFGIFNAAALPAVVGTAIAVADLDGDGDLDAVIGNEVLRNDGTGTFTTLGVGLPFSAPAPRSWRLLDVDGDGDRDAVALDPSGPMVYPNNGNASFSSGVPLEVAGGTLRRRHATGDVDRDGDEDLVTADAHVLANLTRQLSQKGVPRLGHPASLELRATPGSAAYLFASSGLGNLPVPTTGTIFLDLSTIVPFAPRVVGPTGLVTYTFPLPAEPSLAGEVVHWQAWLPATPALTNLETTVLSDL